MRAVKKGKSERMYACNAREVATTRILCHRVFVDSSYLFAGGEGGKKKVRAHLPISGRKNDTMDGRERRVNSAENEDGSNVTTKK